MPFFFLNPKCYLLSFLEKGFTSIVRQSKLVWPKQWILSQTVYHFYIVKWNKVKLTACFAHFLGGKGAQNKVFLCSCCTLTSIVHNYCT